MERDFMLLEGEVGQFAHGKNYLLAIFYFVRGTEGNEVASPSFVSENVAIHATSSLMEALHAT